MHEKDSVSFFNVTAETGTFRKLFELGGLSSRGSFTSESEGTDFKVAIVKDAQFPRKLKVAEIGNVCRGPYKVVPKPSGEQTIPTDGECTTA